MHKRRSSRKETEFLQLKRVSGGSATTIRGCSGCWAGTGSAGTDDAALLAVLYCVQAEASCAEHRAASHRSRLQLLPSGCIAAPPTPGKQLPRAPLHRSTPAMLSGTHARWTLVGWNNTDVSALHVHIRAGGFIACLSRLISSN